VKGVKKMAKKRNPDGELGKTSGHSDAPADRKTKAGGMPPLVRAPSFHKTYVTRAIPFFTEFDVRIAVANEMMEAENGQWCTIADEMLILTPQAAKELASGLMTAVQAYEELNGAIKPRNAKRVLTQFKLEGD
jgi:hypothetical protein